MNASDEIAFANFVAAALEVVAPGLGVELEIIRGRGVTIPELDSAQLRLPDAVADSPIAGVLELAHPTDETKLIERVIERGHVRAELEVRVSEPENAATTAMEICKRLRRELVRDVHRDLLAGRGVGVMSIEDVVDVSSFVRDAQWEGRAMFVIVASYAVIEDSTIDRVASFDVAGELTPDQAPDPEPPLPTTGVGVTIEITP